MANVARIKRSTGEVQVLEEHLINTAELAEKKLAKIGIQGVGYLIGLLHDLGKASNAFENYLIGESDAQRGDVDHSTAGAQLLLEYMKKNKNDSICWNVANQMMQIVVASHHSGLIDCISIDGENTFDKRMTKDHKKTRFEESLSNIDESVIRKAEELYIPAVTSLSSKVDEIIKEGRRTKNTSGFWLGLLSRMILSCLVDADGKESASFDDNLAESMEKIDWDVLKKRYYEYISEFESGDEISRIRTDVSNQCYAASGRERGVFTLSVPTGGGKTLASLRFSIEHLQKHSMDRIFYIAPYTSIIDQNVSVVKNALEREGENFVRAYHSGIDLGNEDENADDSFKYASDPWDSPLVFTTMVQFLETFFSSGTKRARRMHNLANSVIIFDEIQTIPVKSIYLFNEALNFLTKWCGTSVILCTATQPLLGGVGNEWQKTEKRMKHPLDLKPDSEIIKDVGALASSLHRVDVEYINPGSKWDGDEVGKFALEIIEKVNSLLIVTNTKSMAKSIYANLKNCISGDVQLFHLSANMCPAHRKDVLDKVLLNLNNGKLICVSTQLIEAGIDIDFNSVIRCMAGIDSITQAAGRCNRNGRMEKPGMVYIVDTDEKIERLTDIYEGRRCSRDVLREFPNEPIGINAVRRYFGCFFFQREHVMEYPTEHPEISLFQMLSSNTPSVQLYMELNSGKKPGIQLRQSFKKANESFSVIDSPRGVIVDYNSEARDIISELCSDNPKKNLFRLLRSAQKYSVNTYEFDKLRNKGVIRETSEGSGVYFILHGNYDYEYGIREQTEMNTLMY